MPVRRYRMQARRKLGCALALGGVLLVFLCLPMEFFLIALGVGMTALGIALMDG